MNASGWSRKIIGLGMWLVFLSGCAKPAMDSVEINPPTRGLLHFLAQSQMDNVSDLGYKVNVVTAGGNSGNETELRLQVTNPSGKPVGTFTETMTKLMHLIVVSNDLSSFSHIHPEYEGDGNFSVKANFPHGGNYLLVSEFHPDNKGITVTKQWLSVEGNQPTTAKLKPDADLTKTVDGLEATLTLMPGADEIKAKQMVMLNFRFADAATKQPVQLEPYLGTAGHCVILSADLNQYLHVHAVPEMSDERNVMFHTQFPAKGTYKLWVQVGYKGEVIVIPYVISVR